MESKILHPLIKYQKKLKCLLNNNLADIIIFGSSVKGGYAKDIDIGLIVRNSDEVAELKKEIRAIFDKEPDIHVITIDSLYLPIWLTLIKEGFSIKKNRFLYELYNIKPMAMYKYSLKKLTNVQKVQFERGLKNVLKKEGTVLTRSVVLIPLNMMNEMIEFLKGWNIYYETQEYELLPILRKEELL